MASAALSTAAKTASATRALPMIDIGINLLDGMFSGKYRGRRKHDSDLDLVLERAWRGGLTHLVVTAGTLKEARKALEYVRGDERLFSTVGVHPTRANEFEANGRKPEEHTAALLELAKQGQAEGKVVAIGECGLDYDRLKFCSKEVQLRHFARHLELAEATGLPLFLHNRNAGTDLIDVLRENQGRYPGGGVVHSFTGTESELQAFLDLGLYIGLNGCSLKTEENLRVASKVPLDRLMIETDGPWCAIKRTHAGHKFVKTTWSRKKPDKFVPGPDNCVKDRCEPAHLIQVVEVLAGVYELDPVQVAAAAYANTLKVFFPQQASA